MRYKIITLIAVFLMGLLLIPQLSEAAKTVVVPSHHSATGGHSGGSHPGSGKTVVPYPPNYHGGHYGGGYHGGYYGHYYGWPYWGWGGYYPYFGLGFYYGYPYYWGYPYYGYGYGYPYYSPGPVYYGYPVGSVRTEVKPQSAQIFVDGGYVGKADDYDGWWQRLDLEPGPHRLVFRAPGFQPYVVDVRVAPGQDVHLKYQMVAGNDTIDQKDMLLPRSEYQNNRGYGRPYNRPYPPDQRDQQYQRRPPDNQGQYQPMPDENQPPEDNDQGYYGDDQSQNRDQRPLILHVEPSDATIYVDGNYYGTANDDGRSEIQVLLPPGNHRIEVVRPGYESFSQDIMVSKDQDNHVNVILRKK